MYSVMKSPVTPKFGVYTPSDSDDSHACLLTEFIRPVKSRTQDSQQLYLSIKCYCCRYVFVFLCKFGLCAHKWHVLWVAFSGTVGCQCVYWSSAIRICVRDCVASCLSRCVRFSVFTLMHLTHTHSSNTHIYNLDEVKGLVKEQMASLSVQLRNRIWVLTSVSTDSARPPNNLFQCFRGCYSQGAELPSAILYSASIIQKCANTSQDGWELLFCCLPLHLLYSANSFQSKFTARP